MAQYQVPQFIEVEDKIFGPLTLKQFIYLAGAGGVCLIFFTLLPLYLTILFSVPVVILALALAFYQVNGRPFIIAMEHAFSYYIGGKLYLWRQHEAKSAEKLAKPAQTPGGTLPVPKLSDSRLRDLAWSLNIKDRAKMGVKDSQFEI